MKDLYNHIEIAEVFDPVAVTGHTSHQDIDLKGFNSAVIVGLTGAGTIDADTNYMNFRISHADDNGSGAAGTYALCTAADLLGVGAVTDGIPASPVMIAASTAYKIGYVGGKRFLKIELRETGAVNAIIGVYVIKGHGLDVPNPS